LLGIFYLYKTYFNSACEATLGPTYLNVSALGVESNPFVGGSIYCLHALNNYQFIQAPLFIMEYQYDNWQLINSLNIGDTSTTSVTPAQLEFIKKFGESSLETQNRIGLLPGTDYPNPGKAADGLFFPSCYNHGGCTVGPLPPPAGFSRSG
jgi:hypothetical protein